MTQTPYDFVSKFLEENHPDSLPEWENDKMKADFAKLFSTVKKQKKVVDKNKPKKAKSAYMCYCGDVRDSIKKKNPDMKATDVMRELGRQWSEIKDDVMKTRKYVKMAEEDKKRFAKEMESYVPSPEFVEASKNVTTKRAKKPKVDKGPKKAKTAYLWFCEKNREKVKKDNPNAKPTEITAILGALWQEIKGTKKADKYAVMEADGKKKYAVEKAEWDKEHPKEEPVKSKSKSAGKSKGGSRFKDRREEVTVETVSDSE